MTTGHQSTGCIISDTRHFQSFEMLDIK